MTAIGGETAPGFASASCRVRSVLGRGGMSVVYQAENLRLSSIIALKVLAPELASDDVFRARFLEESRIAASLNHPNVIPIYDMGSQDDLLYIAMRYVSGTDLRQMIKKRGRILPATALFLVGQAARALDAAREQLGMDAAYIATVDARETIEAMRDMQTEVLRAFHLT